MALLTKWDPRRWWELRIAQGRLVLDFEELEKRAHLRFTHEHRAAIVQTARWFIEIVYENTDPDETLDAKNFRRTCKRILAAIRRSTKSGKHAYLRGVLERAQRGGLEFSNGEVYRCLEKIRTGRDLGGILSELRDAADRLYKLQFPHGRRSYIYFRSAAAGIYRVYYEAGGKKRYWRYSNDFYTGEALDFIEEAFHQIAECMKDDYLIAFTNNIPPQETFRHHIAEAIVDADTKV